MLTSFLFKKKKDAGFMLTGAHVDSLWECDCFQLYPADEILLDE